MADELKCSECGKDISDPLDQYGEPSVDYPLCRSCDWTFQKEYDKYPDYWIGNGARAGQLSLFDDGGSDGW